LGNIGEKDLQSENALFHRCADKTDGVFEMEFAMYSGVNRLWE
jgi:hypothetical protein